MADNETITDIIAEKRRHADEIERDCAEKMKRGEMVSDCFARELVADIRKEADRLEAARKREVDELTSAIQATVGRSDAEIDRLRREIAELKRAGNAAKLREAAKYVQSTMERLRDPTDKNNAEFIRIWEIVSAALSAPPRNCDVGTAEEQAKRLSEWCNGRHCVNCQFKGGWPDECKLQWAQTPYKEGGAR